METKKPNRVAQTRNQMVQLPDGRVVPMSYYRDMIRRDNE